MTAIFHDTLFAYILRSAFGSRVFPHPDEKSIPPILQEKLSQVSPRHSTQSTFNDVPVADTASVHSEATAVRKGDPEKGKDTFLVEWDGPTDPDVSLAVRCSYTPATPAYATLCLVESTELVECEEDMGHVPDVSLDIHYLRRICYLHCWDPLHL